MEYEGRTIKNDLKNISKKVYLFIKRFNDEKVMKEASNLTFVTVLGFVPFLLFIVFLLPSIPSLNIHQLLQKQLISIFLPESADIIYKQASVLLSKTIPMNVFNVIMVMFTSYSLFYSITSAFDKILGFKTVKKTKTIEILLKFFGTIVFGFLITIFLFSISSISIINVIFKQTLLRKILVMFLPMIVWFILTFLLYFLIPSKRMNIKDIAKVSIIIAIIWFILKNGFDWYINNMTRIHVLYGVIAAFPIFLFWIYANWIITLSGVLLLSSKTKNKNKKQVIVQKTIKIIIEEQKELFIEEDIPLNESQSQELVDLIKEKIECENNNKQ